MSAIRRASSLLMTGRGIRIMRNGMRPSQLWWTRMSFVSLLNDASFSPFVTITHLGPWPASGVSQLSISSTIVTARPLCLWKISQSLSRKSRGYRPFLSFPPFVSCAWASMDVATHSQQLWLPTSNLVFILIHVSSIASTSHQGLPHVPWYASNTTFPGTLCTN